MWGRGAAPRTDQSITRAPDIGIGGLIALFNASTFGDGPTQVDIGAGKTTPASRRVRNGQRCMVSFRSDEACTRLNGLPLRLNAPARGLTP